MSMFDESRAATSVGSRAVAALGACPCGTGRAFAACCGRLHDGEPAGTATELMRSRYAAFALGDEAYLLRTWHPRTRPAGLRLDPHQRWIGLTVESATDGGPKDETGTVTYVARSTDPGGRAHELREHARFARRGGRWAYVDGDVT